jgi:hypothetical protein
MLPASRASAVASRALLLLASGLAAACGRPPAPAFPTGASTPFADFASAYADASATCAKTTTLTVSMGLSGKAGRTRLRGRVDAGFAAPSQMRLEGRAPFGRPVFILTSNQDRALLVLPRDDRVLTGATAAEIVEALAGVPLSPDALRTIVSGCGFNAGDTPTDGRAFTSGPVAVTTGNSTTYLRRAGDAWQIIGATRDSLSVFYSEVQNGRPTVVNLRAGAGGTTANIVFRLSDVEINPTLDPQTFQQQVPAEATPLTIDELRKAGPLGDTGKSSSTT